MITPNDAGIPTWFQNGKGGGRGWSGKYVSDDVKCCWCCHEWRSPRGWGNLSKIWVFCLGNRFCLPPWKIFGPPKKESSYTLIASHAYVNIIAVIIIGGMSLPYITPCRSTIYRPVVVCGVYYVGQSNFVPYKWRVRAIGTMHGFPEYLMVYLYEMWLWVTSYTDVPPSTIEVVFKDWLWYICSIIWY